MSRVKNVGAGVDPEVLDQPVADELAVIKAKMAALMEENAKLREVSAQAAEEGDAGEANASRSANKERYAIIIDEGVEQNSLTSVPICINGRAYLILRGRRVEVPYEVIEVLEHAVIDKSIPQNDANTGLPNGILVRPMRRFPFQNYGMVVDATGTRLVDDEGNRIQKEA